MIRGRRPKPVELKRLAGNPGKRKLPETPKFSVSDLAEPPEDLNDPIAAEIWPQYAPQVTKIRVLRLVDPT